MTAPTPAFYDSASGKPDHARLQFLLQASRIFVCNVANQPGETDGYSVTDYMNQPAPEGQSGESIPTSSQLHFHRA